VGLGPVPDAANGPTGDDGPQGIRRLASASLIPLGSVDRVQADFIGTNVKRVAVHNYGKADYHASGDGAGHGF